MVSVDVVGVQDDQPVSLCVSPEDRRHTEYSVKYESVVSLRRDFQIPSKAHDLRTAEPREEVNQIRLYKV